MKVGGVGVGLGGLAVVIAMHRGVKWLHGKISETNYPISNMVLSCVLRLGPLTSYAISPPFPLVHPLLFWL